jgi:septal ring factor EnvC (AmiA/AmiB activator)
MRQLRSLASVLALLLLASPPAIPQAQPAPEVFTLDDLRKAERERDKALARLRQLEKRDTAAEREAAEIDADLIAAATDSRRREEAAAAAEDRLIALQIDIQDARALMLADEATTEDVLAALMTLSRRPPPALAVSPEATGDAVRAAILMAEVAPALDGRAAELRTQVTTLNRLTAEAARERDLLASAESGLSARRQEIEALASEKRLTRTALSAETGELRAETSRLAAEADTLRQLLDGLARAAPATPGLKPKPPAASVKAKPPPQTKAAAPALPSTSASRPVPQSGAPSGAAPVVPAVGKTLRRYGQLVDGEAHMGLTVATRQGAQVVAPRDGIVQFSGEFRSYGRMIILDTGGGVLVILSGLDALYAEAGQWVLAGEPVGRMAEQKATAPELYLEVRSGGKTVNPERWLGGAL